MEKHIGNQPAVSPRRERLWAHLGSRIKLRREQLGVTGWTAASAVGVDLPMYQDYEQGERLIPADQLAALAQLYNVPVFYFFETLEKIDRAQEVAKGSESEVGYAVATATERIAILIEDFLKLDFARQQCLLVVARALADDSNDSSRWTG
jgi:transcriptional regulator with XRE-family HTH domain